MANGERGPAFGLIQSSFLVGGGGEGGDQDYFE